MAVYRGFIWCRNRKKTVDASITEGGCLWLKGEKKGRGEKRLGGLEGSPDGRITGYRHNAA
jgi:hypothetical protein